MAKPLLSEGLASGPFPTRTGPGMASGALDASPSCLANYAGVRRLWSASRHRWLAFALGLVVVKGPLSLGQ